MNDDIVILRRKSGKSLNEAIKAVEIEEGVSISSLPGFDKIYKNKAAWGGGKNPITEISLFVGADLKANFPPLSSDDATEVHKAIALLEKYADDLVFEQHGVIVDVSSLIKDAI